MLLAVPEGLHLKSVWFCFLLACHGLVLFKFLADDINLSVVLGSLLCRALCRLSRGLPMGMQLLSPKRDLSGLSIFQQYINSLKL